MLQCYLFIVVKLQYKIPYKRVDGRLNISQSQRLLRLDTIFSTALAHDCFTTWGTGTYLYTKNPPKASNETLKDILTIFDDNVGLGITKIFGTFERWSIGHKRVIPTTCPIPTTPTILSASEVFNEYTERGLKYYYKNLIKIHLQKSKLKQNNQTNFWIKLTRRWAITMIPNTVVSSDQIKFKNCLSVFITWRCQCVVKHYRCIVIKSMFRCF